MKTSAYIRRIAIIAAIAFMGINFASCSATDEPYVEGATSQQVTSARVTFTYTVPEELLKYAEITVAYNNNEGTDAKWEPMLDPTFTVTYDLAKFPVTAPVVMIFDRNNRPAQINVDWDLKMDIEADMVIDGRHEIMTTSDTYKLQGNLEQALYKLGTNVLDRTFAVKIAKNGGLQFVN